MGYKFYQLIYKIITRFVWGGVNERQKRDKLARAHSNRYQTSLGGKTKEQCPYQNTDTKSEWFEGQEAIGDRNLGLLR